MPEEYKKLISEAWGDLNYAEAKSNFEDAQILILASIAKSLLLIAKKVTEDSISVDTGSGLE